MGKAPGCIHSSLGRCCKALLHGVKTRRYRRPSVLTANRFALAGKETNERKQCRPVHWIGWGYAGFIRQVRLNAPRAHIFTPADDFGEELRCEAAKKQVEHYKKWSVSEFTPN